MAHPDIQGLKTQLLERLGGELRSIGFTKREGQSFRCAQDFGAWVVHLAFVPHDLDVDVTVDVGLRVDAVEDLTNEGNQFLSTREKRRTATIGVELGNLADGRQRRWTLATGEDIEPVAASILKALHDFGLPYLERYSDLEELLSTLSSNERTSWLYAPVPDARCKSALALAIVLGRRSDAVTIADACRRFLRDRNDPGLSSFEQFAIRVLGA